MKRQKQYPMDGPPLLAQQLILEGPRKNKTKIRQLMKLHKITRPETLAITEIK